MKVLDTLARVYVGPADLEQTLGWYEQLLDETCWLRFAYEEQGLELACVGSVLILAGSSTRLERFRQTDATFLVDDIEAFRKHLLATDARITEEPKDVPTGRNMRAIHPDGTVIEYVQHAPN